MPWLGARANRAHKNIYNNMNNNETTFIGVLMEINLLPVIEKVKDTNKRQQLLREGVARIL